MAWKNAARAKAAQSRATNFSASGGLCHIDTSDIDNLVARLNAAGQSLTQVGEISQEAAKFVLKKAEPRMPERSGKFRGCFKVTKRGQTGAYIKSNKAVPYAGVQEFGGKVWWHTKDKQFHRVRLANGEFRMMKGAMIPVKKAPPGDSHHIYPAWESNTSQINELVADEVAKRLEKVL